MLEMARAFLGRKQLDESRLEAELLVAHALGLTRLQLLMQLDRPVSGVEVDAARDVLVRRGRREPVAYIKGSRGFYGRDFAVGPGVLIPRPETELVVDLVREWAKVRAASSQGTTAPQDSSSPEHATSRGLTLADLGTGSGCLAVTLALELPGSQVVAVDISPTAVTQARRNAEALGCEAEVLVGDGFELLLARGPFDVLVSNPPYVLVEEAPELAPEVRDFEPEVALFAPEGDPDHFVRRIVADFAGLVRPAGSAFIELGWKQSERVLELARSAGLEARVHVDLARIPRVLELRHPLG